MKAGSCEVSRFWLWSKVHITVWAIRKSAPVMMDSQPAWRTKGATIGAGERRGDPIESLITGPRLASEDSRGVDVRFDSPSRRLPAQHLMSFLNVVALLDQHPDGAI
jgi:hypothetical protein